MPVNLEKAVLRPSGGLLLPTTSRVPKLIRMATLEAQRVTPEQLLRKPAAGRFELVDGELMEQKTSVASAWIANRCAWRLTGFIEETQLGFAFGDGLGYRCFPEDPDRILRPDASFIALGRLDANQFTEQYCQIPPDLVAEVVSRGDLYVDVQRKIREYRRAGVRSIWVLNPEQRTLTVYREDGKGCDLGEHQELTGVAVLPGFRCRVADLFPPLTVREA